MNAAPFFLVFILGCGFIVCVDGVDLSRCMGIACASIRYDPVCGSDGKTYRDSCDFILSTCASSPPVTVAHRGACNGAGFLVG